MVCRAVGENVVLAPSAALTAYLPCMYTAHPDGWTMANSLHFDDAPVNLWTHAHIHTRLYASVGLPISKTSTGIPVAVNDRLSKGTSWLSVLLIERRGMWLTSTRRPHGFSANSAWSRRLCSIGSWYHPFNALTIRSWVGMAIANTDHPAFPGSFRRWTRRSI